MSAVSTGFIEKIKRETEKKQRIIDAAAGRIKAELVLKNACYLNVFSNELSYGDIAVAQGRIVGLGEYEGEIEYDVSGKIVCPGFIDAHIHLESSLVTPGEFAKAVLPHGTTTVITDPHEIANVMGCGGIEYMMQSSQGLPIDVHFMLPSCVPATPQDESGATLGYEDIDRFYSHHKVLGLAEMMNYVGVIEGQIEPISKIAASQAHHKKIDGHAPGLSGKQLNAYIAAGVYSDHECSTLDDAMEKLKKGQFIMIREGTAAKNLKALHPLLNWRYESRCMFATDDKHPNDLLKLGHIDYIVRQAVSLGADPIIALKVATHNAARYFLMNNKGAIAPGYLADMVVMDGLDGLNVEKVFKEGRLVYDGEILPLDTPVVDPSLKLRSVDTFNIKPVTELDFAAEKPCGVIGMIAGEIVTKNCGYADKVDVERDILKIAVLERHKGTGHIGIGYIKGYGLKSGAVATSISHDSHNIIAVGCSEKDIAAAVNRVADNRGGITVAENGKILSELALPVAGIMSGDSLETVNARLKACKAAAFQLGVSKDIDPFMTLSFMSLTVIPELRITTRGVIDVATQEYI